MDQVDTEGPLRSPLASDPDLVDVFCREASSLLAALEVEDAWQAVVNAAPVGEPELADRDLDLARRLSPTSRTSNRLTPAATHAASLRLWLKQPRASALPNPTSWRYVERALCTTWAEWEFRT